MRRLLVVLVLLVLVAAAGAAAVLMVRPVWWVRLDHPVRYPTYLKTHARNYDVPAALLAAVAQQESGFDHTARSSAGAVGVMQLTPDTARGIAQRTGGRRFRPADLLDPELNIRYGAWYIAHLHKRYEARDPRAEDEYVLTLAAYNAGQGRVDEWVEERAGADGVLQVEEMPFSETREYVRRVLKLRDDYERAYPSLPSDGAAAQEPAA